MTREEAIAVLENEIKCVDKDCNIERSCGSCSYAMPSKEPILEAYRLAIETLEQEPCEDAISRVETVKFLANHSNEFENAKIRMAFQAASSLVNNPHNLPPVQPKPKTGHWIDGKCSGCGCGSMLGLCIENYCPNCGAKMEVEE